MANLTFKFRKLNPPTVPQFVYMVVRFGRNDKVMCNTILKVAPKYWNFERMRVRKVVEVPMREHINNRLDELAAAFSAFEVEIKGRGQRLTRYNVENFFAQAMGKRAASTGSKFHDFVREYIERNPTRINPRTGQIISEKTQLEHARTYTLIQQFEKEQRKGQLLDFEDITVQLYNEFLSYLQGRGLATNTIGHKVQTLITWLNEATTIGINTNLQYKSPYFKVPAEAADTVYLNKEELQRLADIDLPSERLSRTRDLFLIGACTGLRFSDFTTITAANVRDGLIHVRQQKTGGDVVVPFNDIVRAIWMKYNGAFPPPISNQKFNAYIKEVCELAGITEEVENNQTKGGARVRKIVPKYMLITSHTARRSFATNAYLDGVSPISIMSITGHKTEAQFMKYVRATAEQHARKLQAFWDSAADDVEPSK